MTVLAFTWGILMKTMDELTTMGVQLTFEVHRLLGPALEAAIETNFSNIMHGVKLRMAEERWRPYTLESDLALTRLVEELSDVGLNIDWTVASDSRAAVLLSPHAIHFARVLPLCESTLYRDDEPNDVLSRLLAENYPKLVPYAKDSEEEAVDDEEEVAHI
ncbi:unnamed protein product [Nippostrongylus brasiliensis]|uniref:HPr kinase/phosphorylase n=1 Tax=Nippostrongylus brasiliensis TaxID=27835 RepID=A0A0N4XGB5_NIPBR|nr:unnamed protein product [Nippostrongylus brasiliensis]